jgi:Uma2 family endonuclease
VLRGQHFTRQDLAAMPDDGHRYELVDGAIVVTPAPSPLHQRVAFNLAKALDAASPPGIDVLLAPLDVALSNDSVLQPDVVVAPRAAFTDRDLPKAPLLVVEVLSPSTRIIDLNLKRDRYQRAGCPSYWVVDPDVPSITAWKLLDGVYVEAASASGEESFATTQPYAVTLSPARLTD